MNVTVPISYSKSWSKACVGFRRISSENQKFRRKTKNFVGFRRIFSFGFSARFEYFVVWKPLNLFSSHGHIYVFGFLFLLVKLPMEGLRDSNYLSQLGDSMGHAGANLLFLNSLKELHCQILTFLTLHGDSALHFDHESLSTASIFIYISEALRL